jgi:hypothetical protein
MKALTFHEIRNVVHSICETVDAEYDDTVDVQAAIAESCHEYFIYHGDVWAAASGMRFEYYDAWFEAEESLDGCLTDRDMDDSMYLIVHECLRLLVQDAHDNEDHVRD